MIVGNPRFYSRTGPHTIDSVAAAAGCGCCEGEALLNGLASLEDAHPDEVSFLCDPRGLAALKKTHAGAVLVRPDMRKHVPAGCAALVVDDPSAGWAQVALLFHPVRAVKAGIHPSAATYGAAIDPTAEVGAHATIEIGAEIGARCWVGPGAVIGEGVVLGPDCRVGAHASISHAIIGARVYIYAGARIGQDGFGFTISGAGFRTVPQLGGVVIGDDVEVGANTTIDRGTLRNTVIGDGTRLDNLVQIAHNVRIGRYCAIAAQVGISGSVEIGDFVVMGGQSGVADHMRIGSRARIGAQSGVMSAIEAGAVVVSSPARPIREVFREIATLKKLARRQS